MATSDVVFAARPTCFLTLALAVVGCGSSGTGGGSIAIADYGAESDRQECDYLVNCGFAPDRAACAATPGEGTDGHVLSVVAAVQRGTIAYDGKAAYACINAFWPAADCAQMFVRPEPCTRIFQGQVAAGGACVLSEECADGGTCSHPGKSSACEISSNGISGICARMAEEGEACDVSREFPCNRADDYCDLATRKCAKAKSPGGPCTSAPCLKYAACVDGLCVALPNAGQACLNQLCLGFLLCSSNVCVPRSIEPVCLPP